MKKLIDTSVLHASVIENHPQHHSCREIMRKIYEGEFTGIIVINSFLELFASLTNNKRTDPPLSAHEAYVCIGKYLRYPNIEIAVPSDQVYLRSIEVATSLNLLRTLVFDSLILLAGKAAGAQSAVTLNEGDFKRLGILAVEHP